MTYGCDLAAIRSVKGLTDAEVDAVNAMVATWWRKRPRNLLRETYYDAHNRLHDLGISIPPPLKRVKTYITWPAKAVDCLADRAVLEGFSSEAAADREAVESALSECDFYEVYGQAVVDALVSSCSFLTVTAGDEGEPRAIATAVSARDGSAVWDFRLNRIKCGMAVADVRRDSRGLVVGPSRINVFTDTEVIVIRRAANGRWVLADRMAHSHGRPLMEAVRHAPRLGRPFGKSRISRAVMSITDSAVRQALREEVSAEFMSAPQKYIMGADPDVFGDKAVWEAYIGNFLAVGLNEEGQAPSVGQFAQGSMQPHADYERMLAARFSGETGVPMSSLGVVHDNPSSAEAIYASREDLVIAAGRFNRANAGALARIARAAAATAGDVPVSEVPEVVPRFMNPAIPSAVSMSDAMTKQAAACPGFADTRMYWRQLGYTEDEIDELKSDMMRGEASRTVAALLAPRKGAAGGDTAQPA